jgi:hypothetical protein
MKPGPKRLAAPWMGLDRVVMSGAASDSQGKITIATGVVTKRVEDGRFYVRVDPGPNVGPGFSGGPVEHQSNNTVLGLVQKAPERGGDARFILATVIQDALAGRFPVSISGGPAQNESAGDGPLSRDENFITTLLKAKDRDEHEKQIIDSISDAFDPKTRKYALCVAVLHAPPESCPDIFRSRLADRRFSSKRECCNQRLRSCVAPRQRRINPAPRPSAAAESTVSLPRRNGILATGPFIRSTVSADRRPKKRGPGGIQPGPKRRSKYTVIL